MPPKSPKSSLIPLLILCAAIALWAYDTYRQTDPPRPPSGQASPARTGGYETFADCTIITDRSNDGDSFKVKLPDGRAEIVRLYFVDAPESGFRSYRGGRNNHGRIAQQAADMGGITPQQAVEIGKMAKAFTLSTLEKSPFTIHTAWDNPFNDRRYHAFVEVTSDGKPRFLHELLVEQGLARIRTKGAPLPGGTPERKHENHLLKLQRAAKSKKAGAWGL